MGIERFQTKAINKTCDPTWDVMEGKYILIISMNLVLSVCA